MEKDPKLTGIIKAVLEGEAESKDQLVALITPRIKTYIFRSTLNQDTTEDLLQEVYCKMFASLGILKYFDSFWPWLYRIASNCINSYYRSRSKRTTVCSFQDELLESIVTEKHTVEAKLMNKELGRAVIDAIATLKPRDRQVVTLRCFENYSFKEISQVEQTSEMYSRVLYHRSIEKLRIALKKKGFSKTSLLLALTLFGELTAQTEAAVVIQAGSVMGVGVAKGFSVAAKLIKVGAIVSVYKVKLAVIAVLAAGLLGEAVTIVSYRSNVTSVHYTVQGVVPVAIKNAGSTRSSLSSSFVATDRMSVEYKTKGAYERMLIMPDGPDGPLMRFDQRLSMELGEKQCSWLQDGSGNYYYHSGEKQKYITNDPLRLLVLPTDPPDYVAFIHSQVGYDSRVSYERKFFSGLVKETIDNRVDKYAGFKCKYIYNNFDYEDLLVNWPEAGVVNDQRDPMHKRGWTTFEVTGQIMDKRVSGTGKIPFVYNMYHENLPWLLLKVGDDLYVDYPGSVAIAERQNGKSVYKNATFMEGLCRPWQGLACVDTVRRDAAKYRLRFNMSSKDERAVVTVYLNSGGKRVNMVYDIDLETDVIRSIKFKNGEKVFGELYFDYKQDTADAQSELFTAPQTEITSKKGKPTDNLWLAMLVEDYL